MDRYGKRMHILSIAIPVAVLAGVPLPAAGRSDTLELNLPSQPLSRSLSQLAAQAGVELLFSPSLTGGRRAPAVRGRMSFEQALRTLLGGSGLEYRRGAGGAVVIVAAPAAAIAAVVEPPVPEILVVGRRSQNADIRRTESDIQPYQVAGRDELQDARTQTVESFLRTRLSINAQMSAPAQQAFNNLGSTRSEINLRGLGPRQTLILVDGRRLPSLPSIDSGFYQPDVNALPLAAIARIETITSTAGGIYGPGATGGVVNFVLDRDYRGAMISLTSHATSRGDAGGRRIDGSVGFTPDQGRTNVMLAVSHSDDDSLVFGDRDYTSRARMLKARNDFSALIAQTPVSSSINIFGTAPLTLSSAAGAIPLGAMVTYAPAGAARDGSMLLANAGRIDLSLSPDANGATRTLLPATSRSALLFNVRHRLAEGAEIFLDGLWMRNSGQSIFPWTIQSATVLNAEFRPFDKTVTVTFPMPGFDNLLINRARVSRLAAGLILDLPRNWRANIDYTVGKASQQAQRIGDGPSSSSFDGLLGVTPEGAVPNPFSDQASFLSALEFYRRPNRYEFSVENRMRQMSFRLAGPLFRFSGGPLTLSLLGEDRREHVPASSLTESLLGTAMERPTPEVRQRVRSYYAELRAPLLSEDSRWTWLRSLEVQLAVRNDHYRNTAPSQSGWSALFQTLATSDRNTTVYTGGLRFRPIPAIMMRASLSTGILPPAIDQISSRVVRSFGERDPRRGGTRIGLDVPVLVGGSPSLEPERARSLSAGLVFTTDEDRLRLSVDYTRIEKRDEVVLTSVNGLQYLPDFGDVRFFLANEDRFPGRIARAPLSEADAALGYTGGLITRMDTTALNVGSTRLDAVDLKAEYTATTSGGGQLRLAGSATWQPTLKRRFDENGPWYRLANSFDGALTWRGSGSVRWSQGPMRISLDGYYYGRYRVVPSGPVGFPQASDEAIARLQGSEYISAQTYFDLAAAYRFSLGQGDRRSLELRLGVQNLLDQSPPIVATSDSFTMFAETGYSLLADPRRRRFDVTIAHRF